MTFRIKLRGSRLRTHDFRCPVHGVFEAVVDCDVDEAACPEVTCASCGAEQYQGPAGVECDHHSMCESYERMVPCGLSSPWSPTKAPPMRMKRVEATRGQHEKAEHKGWCNTENLEQGQSFDDWNDDRDAVAEEMRKELVMEAVRSDR